MIYPKAIIPTVLIPFTIVSVLLSTAASFVAALFGIHLSTEGPRRLLEVLLKPRVLVAALAMNAVFYGGYKAWFYYQTLPRFESTIVRENAALAKPSSRVYPDAGEESEGIQASKRKAAPSALERAWTQTLGSGSFAGAVASGESLFIGTDEGRIEELDAATGEGRRSFYVGTSVTSMPTIFNGALYVGEGEHDTHHARVYKFDLRTGRYVGSYATRGHTEGRSLIASWRGRDLLFIPAGSDGVHAVDPQTLKPVWRRLEGHSDATPKVYEGLVFWGTGREKQKESSSKIWAIAASFADGAVKWKHELPASSWMQPVIVGEHVCFPLGEVYFQSEIGGVYCFNRISGQPTLTFNLATGVVSHPILFNGDLIVTGFKGTLCRLSMSQARPLWCTETDNSDYSLASVSYDDEKNVFIYPSRKGGMFVLDPESGAIVSKWTPPEPEKWNSNFAPVTSGGGLWISADTAGAVRAFRLRDAGI